MKEQEKNIELAEYWIFKLEDIYADNLKDYDEYKLYYLPLKSYLLNSTGSSINNDLMHRYEVLYKIPRKYYDIDYTAIRDKIFPLLFYTIMEMPKSEKENELFFGQVYDYSEINFWEFRRNSKFKVEVVRDLPNPNDFSLEVMELEYEVAKKDDYDTDWKTVKLQNMKDFLIEVAPKLILRHIKKLLKSINDESTSTEKPIRLIKENEAISLLERLKNPNYKLSEDDKLIIGNTSFSNYSSNYLKQIGIHSLFDKVFARLKRDGFITYNQFELYTKPPSKWFKDKFINSFIYNCNHKKGRYKGQIGSKKFEYDKIKSINGKHKKCFLLL